MWTLIKRLSLGVILLAAASAVLLLSDTTRRRGAPARLPRLVIMQHASQTIIDDGVRGMVDGLAAAGFVDGRSVTIRRFNAEGDMPTGNAIAKEITGGGYDLILTATTVSLQNVANANQSGKTRHVFALVTDPIAAGVGITGPRPDQHPPHMIGFGTMQPVRETFALARQTFPGLRRVGEVWNPSEANAEAQTVLARAVCKELGIELLEANADSSAGVGEAAGALVARGAEAIWVPGDVTVLTAVDAVVSAARSGGIPVFTSIPGSAQKGTLFDVGASYHEVGRLAGALAARILNGADPATIGVTNVMPQTTAINLTALQGLHDAWRFPPAVLEAADTIIDEKGVHQRAAATPVAVAQAPARRWKIDMLQYVNVQDVEDAERGMRDGLIKSALVEGRDFALTVRNAQGDMPTLSALVDAALTDGTDLLMTLSTPTLQAAIHRAPGVPIVFTFVADAVAAGAGRSNTEHLPNVTGVPTAAAYEDLLAIIRQCLPHARRLGTLFVPSETNSEYNKHAVEQAAPRYGFELVSVPVNTSSEVSDAALSLLARGIDAVCQAGSNLTTAAFASIALPAQRAGVPVFGFLSSDAANGAAVVVARDYYEGGVQAGALAARIMRGESPAAMPFEPVRGKRILVNLDAARAAGIVIPAAVRAQAAHVIGKE